VIFESRLVLPGPVKLSIPLPSVKLDVFIAVLKLKVTDVGAVD
jgi:hypothetical protein